MGVAVQLGLERGVDSESLVEGRGRWKSWAEGQPALAAVAELSALPGWLRTASPLDADEVLAGLVRLGSPTGADEVAASAVVTWALLPGACSLARRLRSLSPEVDVLVAAQLWVEVRSFEWWRLRKVAANVLARTRIQVMAQCGVTSQVRRFDPTWASTSLEDPLSLSWTHRVTDVTSGRCQSGAELQSLLLDAAELGLLSPRDERILERLLLHADRLGGARAGRGQGGLLADPLVAEVAAEVGMSPATVRRRTRRAVLALVEAHRAGLVAA